MNSQTDQVATNFSLPTLSRPSLTSQPSLSAAQIHGAASQSSSPVPRQLQQGQSASASINYAAVTPSASQAPGYGQYGSSRYNQEGAGPYAQSAHALPSGHRMPDVFYLQAANAAIPEDIRNEFQRDEQGHVLFFSKPPIVVQRPELDTPPIQLSTKLRAARIRRRLEDEEQSGEAQAAINTVERPVKRNRPSEEVPQRTQFAAALDRWRDWLHKHDSGTDEIWKLNYGERWQEAKVTELAGLRVRQGQARGHQEMLDQKAPSQSKVLEETRNMFRGPKFYKDDLNPRY